MYLPYLNLAPAEMLALETLPEGDKDALRPAFPLRRWTTSKALEKTFARISKAFGDRPAFLFPPEATSEPEEGSVAAELNALLEPTDGYAAWCALLGSHERRQFIPALQLGDASQFDIQAQRLVALGRGVAILLPRTAFPFAGTISQRTAQHSNGGMGATFFLDLGRETRHLLLQELELRQIGETILTNCPFAKISVTCSTFPESFDSKVSQEIYERSLFQRLRLHFGERIAYSDRGSARVEKGGGGGNLPYPRVDYPLAAEWRFYRTQTSMDYKGGYQEISKKLIDSPLWDPRLRVWGTQMIEKTKIGDATGISSPARSTAVRINLHLHRQLWFDEPQRLYDTDDDWTDD